MKRFLLPGVLSLIFPILAAAPAEQRFEAENVLLNSEVIQINTHKKGIWNLWSTDLDAEKKWSEGIVIQGNIVDVDSKPGENMPILKFRIPVAEDGVYNLAAGIMRSVGISLDGGENWSRQDGSGIIVRGRKLKAGEAIEFQIAASYVAPDKPGAPYIDYFTLIPVQETTLLTNGNFENAELGKIPEGWTFWMREPVSASATAAENAKSGKRAVRIVNSGGRDWAFTSTLVNVKAGEHFEVLCYVRNNTEKQPEVNLQVSSYAGKKVADFGMASLTLKNISGEWQAFRLKFTVPDGVDRVGVRLIGTGQCDIMVDDVQLIPDSGEAETVSFKGEDFQSATPGKIPANWTPWARSGMGLKIETVDDGENLAVRIQSTGKADFAFTFKEVQSVLPGSVIRFSCRAKSTEDAPNNATLQVMGFKDGKLVQFGLGSKSLRPLTTEWREVAAEVVIPESVNGISFRVIGEGNCDILVDDFKLASVSKKSAAMLPKGIGPRKVEAIAKTRMEEKLDRGLVALPLESGELYLSWRLLKEDPDRIGFDVFSIVNGEEKKLNTSPLIQTTDFMVKAPTSGTRYQVRPASGFTGISGSVEHLAIREDRNPFFSYKLSDPAALVNKVGIGDLDGDGRYDFVVRYGNANVDPWYLFWKPSQQPFTLEAVSADGHSLWKRDLGWNIESGIWYSPYLVYDINGDGKAEVILKASDPDAGDLREKEGEDKGKVMTGAEYLMVLDGESGKELARVPWPDRNHFDGQNMAYNYYSRNQLAIAYLDGKTPSIVALRGTYGLMLAEAWRWNDGKLEALWSYNSSDHGRAFHGQGAHSTRAVDLDGDGRDEIILGGAVLDDDGRPLWSTGHGHPDFVYVSDIMPNNPGLEVVTIYETACPKGGGFTCADAKTGKVLWALDQPANHIHYGYAGDIDARYRGWEVGGSDTSGGEEKTSDISRHYSPDGELLLFGKEAPYTGSEQFAYWDADLQREHVRPVLLDYRGGPSGGSYSGRFLMAADVLGDWREEILTAQRGEFRIYCTDIPAMDRRVCLMQDPNYRQTVAVNAMGYVYDPALSYLPTSVSPNLNLTFRNREEGATLQVVVSAPLDQPLKGVLKLTGNRNISFARTEIPIDLKAGGLETFEVAVERPFPPFALIKGELTLDNGVVLRGQVPTGIRPPKPIQVSGILTEAEDFFQEAGGSVVIRTDKSGVHGKCFSHWDKAGHALTWKLIVPKSGKYQIGLRYANTEEVARKITLDGTEYGDFRIPASGGFGDSASDWDFYKLERNGGQLVFSLQEGTVELKATNVSGSMNLDYIQLIPVP